MGLWGLIRHTSFSLVCKIELTYSQGEMKCTCRARAVAALLHTSHDGEAAMNRIAQLTSTGADIDTGLRCHLLALSLTVVAPA